MRKDGQQASTRAVESSEDHGTLSRPAVVLGALMALAGLLVLGDVLLAASVSMALLGWLALLGGLAGLVASLFHRARPGSWPTLLGGALAFVVGSTVLRRPGLSAAALTLLLGTAFLIGGLVRLVGGLGERNENSSWITANGVVTLVLGLLVVAGSPVLALPALGAVLGLGLVVEGVTSVLLSHRDDGACLEPPDSSHQIVLTHDLHAEAM